MPAHLHALDLPPSFRPVALREAGNAFAHACAHAAELGAGSLVFVGRFDLAEFAVVLEPEEPLVQARLSFYAGMTALGDTLSALAPPEMPVAIEWPDRLQIDRGRVGSARLGWPPGADEQARPDWLVFGAVIRLVSMPSGRAGPYPISASLTDAGFAEVGAQRLIEGFARHLMVAIDRWQEGGLTATARDYLARLRPEPGVRRGIDAGGNLRIERLGEAERSLDLCAALSDSSRLDREPARHCGHPQ